MTVPEYLEFQDWDPSKALEFLNGGGGDYVVKPALDTGAGIGVTSGVRTASDLHRAILRASRAGDRILVERQASGSEYRVLVLDGVVIDIVCRHPPAVVGDGRSTIAQLIGAENRRRLEGDAFERLRMLTADLDCVLALRREGLELAHVAAGRRVVVKGVVNQNAPAENETLRAALPAALHTAAIAAARATGLRLAGVDVVATEEADQAGGGVVLEVNPAPRPPSSLRCRESRRRDACGDAHSADGSGRRAPKASQGRQPKLKVLASIHRITATSTRPRSGCTSHLV